MLTVLADDITGAAEIAGIGYRFGLRTALVTEVGETLPECDVLVVATDTRSMTEAEAVAETHRVTSALRQAGASHFFKKTDSALRGHVVAELLALLNETDYQQALYLPCNPSKGRIIKEGNYYINGQPLHETPFSYDPEFPALSSELTTRFLGVQLWNATVGDAGYPSACLHAPEMPVSPTVGDGWMTGAVGPEENPLLRLLEASAKLPPLPIYVTDAETVEQMAEVVASVVEGAVHTTLLAGAADLFTAYIRRLFGKEQSPEGTAFDGLSASGKALVVCGSTQSSSLVSQPYIRQYQIPESQMPLSVFEGTENADAWVNRLALQFAQSHSMILSIGYPSKGGKEFALRLRTTMAAVVARLVAQFCPDELVIEGGATAFAILQQLGWNSFRLTDEVAPGVVRMQRMDVENCHITLKPGSYVWGRLFD